ncbi:MAG: hypothetical protein IM620_21520 [Cytophagales bacterium]|nr:hypothetical protein [Cytophagales bacterium]
MGFSSINDFQTEAVTNGKTFFSFFNKLAAHTSVGEAGRWYDLARATGTPQSTSYAGTALNWVACSESDLFGIPHGGNVSSDTKHISRVSIDCTVQATGIGQLMLVDLQGYWAGISTASAVAQNLVGTPGSNLRYANGAGCRLYFSQVAASGATASNITISYTNQAGTTGRGLPWTPAINTGAIVQSTSISNSGQRLGHTPGPFLPLANGDTGVANVASVTFSASTGGGTVALCLAKPLLTMPLVQVNTVTERDLFYQMTNLPRVVDGACLVWLLHPAGNLALNPVYRGGLTFNWG